MPVFSKIASPDYASTEDDFSVYDLGSFSPPPLQNNRPVPAGGRLGVSHLAEATPVHRHSRHPGSTVSFNHTGATTGFHQRFHHAPGSEDHRSRSYISISSDDHPDATDTELTKMREEIAQLRGQITGLSVAHSGLLTSISKDVKSMKEDMTKILDHVTGPATGTPGPPIGEVSGIPQEPREEDFKHLGWWRQGPWLEVKNGTQPKAGTPTISLYMEDEFGREISPGIKTALRKDLYSYWTDINDKGETLTNISETGLGRKEDFRATFEAKYPWLRLCEGHWKVDQLWVNYFGSWKKSRLLATPERPNPSPKEHSPIETYSVEGNASVGSKRGLEDLGDPDRDAASKRQKGKEVDIMAPTKFNVGSRSRPKPTARKRTPKVAKDITASSPLPPVFPQPSNVRDVPVASGSGTMHSSPHPPPPKQVVPPGPQPPHASNDASATQVEAVLGSQIASLPEFSLPGFDTPPRYPRIHHSSQPGSLPEYYTSPIIPPPAFTPVRLTAELESITESSTASTASPVPTEPLKKAKGRVAYKRLICQDWMDAGKGNKGSFERDWAKRSKEEREALVANKKSELAAAAK